MPDLAAPPEFNAEAAAEATLAWGWTLLADRAEHVTHGGYTYDPREATYVCQCGRPIFRLVLLEQVAA